MDVRQAFTAVPIPAQIMTATLTGLGLDCSNTSLPMSYLVDLGAITGGAPTLVVQAQESADNITYANIPGATATSPSLTAAGLTILCVLGGTKQYQRLVATQTGAGNIPICALALAQPRMAGNSAGFSTSPQV